jgi:RNA 2',3'-cyclic 3'-phosphodiesterase
MSSPEHAETQRLFFALWPSPEVRERLRQLTRKALHKNGRAVTPENLHITLVFLGSVPRERAACVREAAARLTGAPFRLVLDRLGHFPRPRVLWAGPSELPPALTDLVRGLTAAARQCGIETEERAYRAHATLARKVNRPAAGISGHGLAIDPLGWEVEHFVLVRSVTHSEGAQYEVIASWPLAAQAEASPPPEPRTFDS